MRSFKGFLAGIMIIGCILIVQNCGAQDFDMFSNYADFSKTFETILQKYSIEDEDEKIDRLWDEFLKETTNFYSSEYEKVCKQFERQYLQSLIDLNACSEKTTEIERSYSSQWVDDLIKQFGKAYVLKNMELIRLHLGYFYISNNTKFCKELKKDVIYQEFQYKTAFNKYLNLYIEFIESLDEEQKIKLSKRKTAVEELIEMFNKVSIKDIFSGSALRASLFSVAIKDRPNSDAALTEFFLQQPVFSKPFNVMECFNDLNTLNED